MSQFSRLFPRIAVDATVFELPPTGIAKATLGLYESCLEIDAGLQVEFLHRLPLQAALPSGIRDVQFPGVIPGRPAMFWKTLSLPCHVARAHPQVLHFPWNGGLPPYLPQGLLRVMTLHDVLPMEIPGYLTPSKRRRYIRRTQRDIKRAHLVITDSEYSRYRICSEFTLNHEPVVVYPLSSPPPHPASQRVDKEGAVPPREYFLYCGGYDKRKGLEELAEAFNRLWQDPHFRVPLIVTGIPHAFSPRLATLLADGRKRGAIHERGYVSDAELISLYRGALALVYPSRYEGFGLPPWEAMANGCPVITHRSTSLPEVCGDAALYLEDHSAGAIERAVRALTANDELRQRLSEKGSRQSQKFSGRESAKRFLEAITRRRAELESRF